MSTTAAPPAATNTDDVAEGLRRIMLVVKAMSERVILDRAGQAPLCADLKVADSYSVNAFALLFGAKVTTSTVGPVEVVKTSARYDGVHLTVHAVIHKEPTLRRDPGATVALAERDA